MTRHWLNDEKREQFAEIYDCAPHEVDAHLDRQEGITASTLMGATNPLDAVRAADEAARPAVEGEQVEEHHPIIERAA